MTDTQKILEKQTAEVSKLVKGMLNCQNTLYGCKECDYWVEKINAIFRFTGFLDKNGKEIREGDILVKDGVGWYFIVVWSHDRWAIEDSSGTHDIRGSLKIIGNIDQKTK